MGLLKKLIFDTVDTSDYGVFISGEGRYNAPARRGEMITVPGRNGTLFRDEGSFENIEVTYPAFMAKANETTFAKRLRDLRSELSARETYCRLEDTYHTDEFRLGVFHAGVETEPTHYTRAGSFDLVFDCKPQRFLKSGEIALTYNAGRSSSITNPTPFTAKPLIKVDGYGLITIGDYQISVAENETPFWIDSELMVAYIPAGETYIWTDERNANMTDEHGFELTFADGLVTPANMLPFVSFKNHKFPLLEPGTHAVEVADTFNSVMIIPRWWLL